MKKAGCAAVVAVIGLSVWVRAHEHEMASRPVSSQFEQMKKLVGTWRGKTAKPDPKMGEEITVSFRMTAAGSAIEETLMPGTPHEMVDMYHDEAGQLAMTHYCAMGNQPHMVVTQSGPNRIALEMNQTPGIDPKKDSHMHALTLEFPDANHLTERWQNYTDGKPAETVTFALTRVNS
jgi:hypothetical protein